MHTERIGRADARNIKYLQPKPDTVSRVCERASNAEELDNEQQRFVAEVRICSMLSAATALDLFMLPVTRPGSQNASTSPRIRRRRAIRVLLACTGAIALLIASSQRPLATARLHRAVTTTISHIQRYDWRGAIMFRITAPMRVSIALSLVLGVLLGGGVGVLSGLEPAVVIGVSASMALGCVFVMTFAIVHGVNVLRATAFAVFVSACLPLGFGIGFGCGVLVAVFIGLEHPDDVREKTTHFITHLSDFAKVVLAFTLEII